MQRKKHLLKSRDAFAMIMAIAVIVILTSIMALSISLTSQTTKRTTDIYIHEQAILLSKSASEYALLQISQNPPCSIPSISFTDEYYNIEVNLSYIYTDPSPCALANKYFDINTSESNGSVLMDVAVSVTDTNITSEPIRYFRRSIQKL